VLCRQQGDDRAALAHHEEALALFRRAGDRDGMVVTLVNLGLASSRLGLEAAGAWIDEALAHARDLRARRAGASALQVAAAVLEDRGLAAEAARLVGAAEALRTAIGMAADPWWAQMQGALVERLLTALGGAAFERLAAEGRLRTFEQAVDDARRLL